MQNNNQIHMDGEQENLEKNTFLESRRLYNIYNRIHLVRFCHSLSTIKMAYGRIQFEQCVQTIDLQVIVDLGLGD